MIRFSIYGYAASHTVHISCRQQADYVVTELLLEGWVFSSLLAFPTFPSSAGLSLLITTAKPPFSGNKGAGKNTPLLDA